MRRDPKKVGLEISWNDLYDFYNCRGLRIAYLKILASLWNIEVSSMAEIGVYRGNSSQSLRCCFPKASLYLIDPWVLYDAYRSPMAGPISKKAEDYEQAYLHVKEVFAKDPNVHILRKTSEEAASLVPDGLDLVFIDGNHDYEYVKQDIALWQPKIRKGGLLAGHDFCRDVFPGVVRAVEERFGEEIAIGPNHMWAIVV